MYNIIERYIKNLSKEQVNNFALKNNVNLSGLELDFLYVFIKKNYKEVLANPSLLNLDIKQSSPKKTLSKSKNYLMNIYLNMVLIYNNF